MVIRVATAVAVGVTQLLILVVQIIKVAAVTVVVLILNHQAIRYVLAIVLPLKRRRVVTAVIVNQLELILVMQIVIQRLRAAIIPTLLPAILKVVLRILQKIRIALLIIIAAHHQTWQQPLRIKLTP